MNHFFKRCHQMAFAFIMAIGVAHADWTPPKDPHPSKILDEAEADTAAGRYEDALSKHEWFHRNALKHEPALYGVRLSFALSDWAKLAAAYPPALEKLKSIRDEAAANIRAAKASFNAFHDFTSINNYLKEDDKTKELFVWVDANNPSLAKKVYDLAQPTLIQAKEYAVCGKYINPDPRRILDSYRSIKGMAQDGRFDKTSPGEVKKLQEHAEKNLKNQTAILVALLVLNERNADRLAAEAAKLWDDPQFKQQLEKARNGEVPPQRL
jgi:hypothetical protein